jgi:biopolymer transport protein ExbD
MQMRALVIAVVSLAGCGNKRGGAPVDDDCKIVLGDPANATVAMTQRYPGAPVKVAEVIESCIAPSGDDCERLAKLVAAIPAMMPAIKAPSGDVARTCRAMPPEMRRCMLPSYQLAHVDECREVYDHIAATKITSMEITPSHARVPSCEPVVLAVRSDGLRLATRADGRCFRARAAGQLDLAWLEAELTTALAHDCAVTIEIGATPDTKYQEVVSVMDVAMKAGIGGAIGMTSMADLSVKLDGDPTKDAAHCPAMVMSKAPAEPAPAAAAPPVTSTGSALAKAPVVIVSRDEVTVGGKHVASVAELAAGDGTIAALVAAVPATPADRTVILQADQSSDMKVITRIIDTLKGAGYDNVLFAVKNK